MRKERTPISLRRGIEISRETRDRSLDDDPDSKPLPPDRWAQAIRRDEVFRPVKKPTTVRIDADVLDWLRPPLRCY